MSTWPRALALVLVALLLTIGPPGFAAAAPNGEMTWALHVSLAPTGFDPAETPRRTGWRTNSSSTRA